MIRIYGSAMMEGAVIGLSLGSALALWNGDYWHAFTFAFIGAVYLLVDGARTGPA